MQFTSHFPVIIVEKLFVDYYASSAMSTDMHLPRFIIIAKEIVYGRS